MPKEVYAFKCEWCSKIMGRKVNAIQHEERCKSNPIMRHCKTCMNGYIKIVDRIQTEEGPFSKANEYEVTEVYCKRFDKPIHEKPYLIECDCSYGYDGSEHDMPFTCFYYEYQGYAGYKKPNETN